MKKVLSLTMITMLITPLTMIVGGGVASLEATPSVRLELTSDLPLQLGGSAMVETDQGWRLFSSIGIMPSPYVELSNQVIMLIPDTYDEATAQLINDTIQNSIVWRIMGGWKAPNIGFYTHIGYSLVTLGGGASTAALIEGITGESIEYERDPRSNRSPIEIDAEATLHLLGVELGWEWRLKELKPKRWLTLRAALGWSYTFSSVAHLKADVSDRKAVVQEAYQKLERAGEVYLVDTFETYVHPPTISLALGYQWD